MSKQQIFIVALVLSLITVATIFLYRSYQLPNQQPKPEGTQEISIGTSVDVETNRTERTEEEQQTSENTREEETQLTEKFFVIEADDYGFYLEGNRINSISVLKNQPTRINFKVKSVGVYYDGLDFRSIYFNTGKVSPGEDKLVSFTPTQSFVITSYWPASGIMKASLQVVVSD